MNTNLSVVNIVSAAMEPSLGEWHKRLNEARRSTVNSVLNLAGEYCAFARSCERTQGGSLYTAKMQEWYEIGKVTAWKWVALGSARDKLLLHEEGLPEAMQTMYIIRELPDEIIAEKVTPHTTQREANMLRAQFNPAPTKSTLDQTRNKAGRRLVLAKGKMTLGQRAAQVRPLVASGMTTDQIATEIGIGAHAVAKVMKKAGIKNKAQAAMGKSRRLDPLRIINESVVTLSAVGDGIERIKNSEFSLAKPDAISLFSELQSATTRINWLARRLRRIINEAI